MVRTRRWLRVLASGWLACQLSAGAIALGAALVPPTAEARCCAHMAPGQVCPMHRKAATERGRDACRLLCANAGRVALCPITDLAGPLPVPGGIASLPERSPASPVAPSSTISRSRPPATPPPRA